jgi:hypothetical protein
MFYGSDSCIPPLRFSKKEHLCLTTQLTKLLFLQDVNFSSHPHFYSTLSPAIPTVVPTNCITLLCSQLSPRPYHRSDG